MITAVNKKAAIVPMICSKRVISYVYVPSLDSQEFKN
jgi:hypothetical protein